LVRGRDRRTLAASVLAAALGVVVGCGSDDFLGSGDEGSGGGVTLNWFQRRIVAGLTAGAVKG
jgi:hypothetical protein